MAVEQNPAQGRSAPEQDPRSDRERLEEIYRSMRQGSAEGQPSQAQQHEAVVGGLWERLKGRLFGDRVSKKTLSDLITGEQSTEPTVVDRIKDRLVGEGARRERERDFDRLRSVLRGPVNAANAAIQTGVELVTQKHNPKFDQVIPTDQIFGPRSDDFVAGLYESLSQGVTSAVALRGAGIKNAFVVGALTDAVAFNPYEVGLSELAAQHGDKLPFLGKFAQVIGKALEVDADDNPMWARAKRMIEGSIVGAIFSGAFKGAKWTHEKIRAEKVLADPKAPLVAKQAAAQKVAEADTKLREIEDGAHTPDEARVVARPNEDGSRSIAQLPRKGEVNGIPEDDIMGIPTKGEPGVQIHDLSGEGEQAKLVMARDENGETIGYLHLTQSQDGSGWDALDVVVDKTKRRQGVGTSMYKAAQDAGLNVRSGTNFLTDDGNQFTRRLADQGLTERNEAKFTRTEAEVQAATMDYAIRQQESPKGAHFTDADVQAHVEIAERIRNAPTIEEAVKIVGGEDHFNLGAIADSEDFNLQMRAIIARYQEAYSGAKRRPVVTHKETVAAAAGFAKELGIEDYARMLAESNDPFTLEVETALKVSALRQIGERVAEAAVLVRSRPHDPAVLAEASRLLDLQHEIGLKVFAHRSDVGRANNILGFLKKNRAEEIRFKEGAQVQVRAEAKAAVKEAKAEVEKVRKASKAKPKTEDAKEKEPKGPESKDTNAVTASDFSLARAREHAERVQAALEKLGIENDPMPVHDPEKAIKRAEDIKEKADAQRDNPLSVSGEDIAVVKDAQATRRESLANPIEELSKWLDGAERKLDKELQSAGKRGESSRLREREKAGTAFNRRENEMETPIDRRIESAERESLTANMSPEEKRMYLRLFERSSGDVRDLPTILDTMAKGMEEARQLDLEKSGFAKLEDFVQTYFVNALISGFKTMQSILLSGTVMNAYEGAARMLAGAATGNKALAQEGAAYLYSLVRYAWENMLGARAAFKHGNSVVAGAPPLHVRSGLSGKVYNAITIPGRTAGMLDEFTKLSAYRAEEFAEALRMAREDGLSWNDALKRAESDVHYSVDGPTGIAKNPQALERATIPTLSGPLGEDTAMGKITQGLNKVPFIRLFVPFMNVSVHTFRYVWQNTPGLNRLSKEMREVYAAGGEEAAVLSARTTMAGSMMLGAYALYLQGRITGAGPKNKTAREARQHNHKPYTIRLGDNTEISYRRMEPFASWLGMMADFAETMHEMDSEGDAEKLLSAIAIATTRNSYNKSWTQGIAEIMTAIGSEDADRGGRVIRNIASGFVPYALSQFNPDPAFHEARGLLDGARAKIPILSEGLPLKYNMVGEPIMRTGSIINRNMTMFPLSDASPSLLEDTLGDLGIGLSRYPTKLAKGQIDLLDQRWAKNDVLPYTRMMDIMRANNARGQLEDLIKSETFRNASSGTSVYPGGKRGEMLMAKLDQIQEKARDQMLKEYASTGLADAYKAAQYKLPLAARYKGPDAETAVREKYGVPVPR